MTAARHVRRGLCAMLAPLSAMLKRANFNQTALLALEAHLNLLQEGCLCSVAQSVTDLYYRLLHYTT